MDHNDYNENELLTEPIIYEEETQNTVVGIGPYLHKTFGYRVIQFLTDQQQENIQSTAWEPVTRNPILSIYNMSNEAE